MKKQIILPLLLAVVCSLEAAGTKQWFSPEAHSPRRIIIGQKPALTLCRDGKVNFEVVRPANGYANQAERELIARLQQITGAKIKSVKKASGKVPAFYLGVCPESKAAGLDPRKLDRDGFFIKTVGNKIFITGEDSNHPKPYMCGTLFGVYEFLERFAGVRYYFPGEIGTIVPVRKNWQIPEIDITERPDTQYRQLYVYPAAGGTQKKFVYPGLSRNNIPEWRNSTVTVVRPCHGLNALELAKRFGKTKPELFAMTENGKRHDGTLVTTSYHKLGHLCFSSPELKEIVYQDAVAALTGKPSSSRGISRWTTAWNNLVVNPSPNDGLIWCLCPKCKAIQKKGRQAMSDHIWNFTIELANRLKANKIPGIVTFDSYGVYNQLPTGKIPDNVMVGICINGPWAMDSAHARARDTRRLEAWRKRIGYKINSWTYITKASAAVPDVPNFTPRAVGRFYKKWKDHIFGGFCEAGSDNWLFGFLNYYVYSKLLWNWETDPEALIQEHCRLMYGSAAGIMDRFYREIEELWMKKIIREVIQTPWGENWLLPTRREIWTDIYSPAKIAELTALFDKAEKAAAKDPGSLKRIRFMRKFFWQPVIDGSKRFSAEANNRTMWTLRSAPAGKMVIDGKLSEKEWKKADTIWLLPSRKQDKLEVNTRVKMLQDKDHFYFAFEADEPETDLMVAPVNRKPDNSDAWRDNGIEIFLAPAVDSKIFYQFIVNSAGYKCDLFNKNERYIDGFDSGFEVKTSVVPGKMWIAELKIPRKSMPDLKDLKSLMGNFTRHRVLQGKVVPTEFYLWHPKTRNIPENFGIIQLDPAPASKNLIYGSDFEYPLIKNRYMGISGWASVAKGPLRLDKEIFLTKGRSLLLTGNSDTVRQTMPISPGKKYRMSFYARTEDLSPGLRVLLRFGGDPAPGIYFLGNYLDYIRGTTGWMRYEKTFTAPKVFGKQYPVFVEFFIGKKNKGKCWIDHVVLEEVK